MHFALYIERKHLRLTSSKIMKSISLVEPMMRTLIKLQMHLYVTSFITRNQYHPLQKIIRVTFNKSYFRGMSFDYRATEIDTFQVIVSAHQNIF